MGLLNKKIDRKKILQWLKDCFETYQPDSITGNSCKMLEFRFE